MFANAARHIMEISANYADHMQEANVGEQIVSNIAHHPRGACDRLSQASLMALSSPGYGC